MKPDSYMPYFGSELENATKGYSSGVKWGYVSCLWHYWSHTHCQGLPDDDDYLRNLCECPPQDWARTKPIIFGIFFKLENGQWHQDRCRKEYLKSESLYRVRSVAGKAGSGSRWQTDSKPDSKADGKTMGGTSSSYSSSGSGSGSGGVGGDEPLRLFSEIRDRLCQLYSRKDDVMPYAEQTLLAEICRRGDPQGELGELMAYQRALPAAEKGFFPRSLQSLLEKWQPTLDKARGSIVVAPKTLMEKEMDAALKSVEGLYE